MWDNLFGSIDLLQNGIEASWLRNEVINNNIANADTVGYKASEVDFEDLFAKSLKDSGNISLATTDERHIAVGASDAADVQAVVSTDTNSSLRYDGNNVDVEHEMAELSKNTIEYYTMVSKVNSEFRKLDTAIKVT